MKGGQTQYQVGRTSSFVSKRWQSVFRVAEQSANVTQSLAKEYVVRRWLPVDLVSKFCLQRISYVGVRLYMVLAQEVVGSKC